MIGRVRIYAHRLAMVQGTGPVHLTKQPHAPLTLPQPLPV